MNKEDKYSLGYSIGKSIQKNEDEYATYEEYNDIMDISMSLSNENQSLQSQLDIANKKLEDIENLVKTKMYVFSFNQMMILANEDDYKELLKIIGGE